MRKIYYVFLMFLLLLPEDSQGAVIRKKRPYAWEPAGNVKVLHETPIGKVYQFAESGFFNKEERHGASMKIQWKNPSLNRRKSDDGFHTLNLVLYDNNREQEERKERYLVVEFSIRAFPVQKQKKKLERIQHNGLASLLLLASGNYESITSLGAVRFVFPNIKGITYDPRSTNLRLDPEQLYKKEKKYVTNSLHNFSTNSRCFPMYSLTPCRIIMERKTPHLVAVNYSGLKKIVIPDSEWDFSRRPIAALALATVSSEAVLEITTPTVRFMEEAELKALPPLTMQPYPYELYRNDRKSIRRWGSNPDFEYAQAMNLLYGNDQDWKKGIKEMRLLANKDHALALFQAGCAYYRGIGCEIDLNKAESYFKDAMNLLVPGALTMRKAAVYRKYLMTGKNEWNSSGNAVRLLKTEKIEEMEDPYLPPAILYGIRITGNPKVEFYALLKKLPNKYFGQDFLQALDSLCRQDFTPAIYLRASYKGNSPAETQKLYEKGAALGDPFCSLETIRMKMRSPGFQASMLSINELWNARSIPFIHALLYGIRKPQSKYYKAIQNGETALLKSMNPSTPEEHFLYGISFLQDFLYEQESFGQFRFFSPKRSLYFAKALETPIPTALKNQLRNALKSLEIAAENGIPEAQFFVADPWTMKNVFAFNQFKSRTYLEASAKQNLFSTIKTARLFLEQRNPDKALEFMNLIPDQNSMIALELRAQYLHLKKPNSPESIAAWNNAGAAGSLSAMQFLGNYEYKNKNFSKAAAYRQVFLKTDTRLRNMDLNEIAWGDYFTRYDLTSPATENISRRYSGLSNQEAKRLFELIP